MAKATKEERAEALASLRKMLKPGDRVMTILRHVSASGMSRTIDLVIIGKQTENVYPKLASGMTDWNATPKRKTTPIIRSIGWLAARAMDRQFDSSRQGIKIGGCGMDMGYSLVYDLGATIWPKGTRKPHSTRNGQPDRDGGYALNHAWL